MHRQVRLKQIFILLGVLVFSGIALSSSAQNGTRAAAYAFNNFLGNEEFGGEGCTNFVSWCQNYGGWGMRGTWPFGRDDDMNWYYQGGPIPSSKKATRTWTFADAFKNHIIKTGRAWEVNSPYYLRPGDMIGCDWGDGDLNKSSDHNKSDGSIDHWLIITQNLGNGDVMYAQHSPGKMWNFQSVRNHPSMRQARFYYYHVSGNGSLYSTGGPVENGMYRMDGHPEVYLYCNGGYLWIHTGDDVNYYGGWGRVAVVPNGSIQVPNSGSTPLGGTIVKERSRPECWLVDTTGGLHHLLTNDSVNRYGDWSGLRIVPDHSLDPFGRANDIR
jgi:hypothetical protein